jgi:uncharacterized protein
VRPRGASPSPGSNSLSTALEYLAFALWCFLVALLGGLVGLVLGNLRLPATVLLASSPAAGAGSNLAISAAAAGTASVAHVRAGRINWRLFAWMAPPSVAGAVAGGYLSGEMDEDVLLWIIAAVLLYSGLDLLRWDPAARRPDRPAEGESGVNVPAAVIAGGLIGLLGGIVGLILGSLRMPALLRWVHETPQRAVGTNVTVGLLVGIAGAIGHLPSAAPDLDLLLVGCVASVPGALLGSRLTGRLSERALVRAIALVLLLASAGIAAQALT